MVAMKMFYGVVSILYYVTIPAGQERQHNPASKLCEFSITKMRTFRMLSA
jgi:hypothetical protein